MTRLKFKWEKAIQAIGFIAEQQPGITQYYIGKILFFADREHLLDYGRPVVGDRYVAMEHGPVPSVVRDLLRFDAGYPDEVLELLGDQIEVQQIGNKQHVHAKAGHDYPSLSGSDKEYLREATAHYGRMSFGQLRDLSHLDPAYEDAWSKPGNNNEMDIELWLTEWLDEPEAAKEQLQQTAMCG